MTIYYSKELLLKRMKEQKEEFFVSLVFLSDKSKLSFVHIKYQKMLGIGLKSLKLVLVSQKRNNCNQTET